MLYCELQCFLEVVMTAKKSRVFPPSVQVYFTGRDKALYKKVMSVSKAHGMSASTVAALAIRLGLPLVKRNLEGLLIDIESQAEDHEEKNGLFLEH